MEGRIIATREGTITQFAVSWKFGLQTSYIWFSPLHLAPQEIRKQMLRFTHGRDNQ